MTCCPGAGTGRGQAGRLPASRSEWRRSALHLRWSPWQAAFTLLSLWSLIRLGFALTPKYSRHMINRSEREADFGAVFAVQFAPTQQFGRYGCRRDSLHPLQYKVTGLQGKAVADFD